MGQTVRRWLVLTGVAVLAISASAPPALGGIPSVPPDLAVDDAYSVDEDGVLSLGAPGVLENDVTGPSSCGAATDTAGLAGSVALAPDGSFLFTPTTNFNGETAFTYGLKTIGAEGCPGPYDDQATVRITVNAVNDAPTAVGDGFQFVWGQTLTIAGPGVLANDSDVDGNPLTAIVATNPAHGVLTLAANGGFSYTPAAAPCPGVADAFSYRASDGTTTSAARAVILSPAPIPCPTAVPTPTPSVTPSPTPTSTAEPSASASVEPSPSAEASPTASPSLEPSLVPSPSPAPSEAPEPVDEEGGVSLPVLLVLVLLAVLAAFGAAFYVPRWVEARRSGGEPPGP